MDPSMYIPYTPPAGLPQESKLATYMNRAAATPTRSLNQAMGKLNIESSSADVKKTMLAHMPHPQVLMSEYMPMNYYNPPAMMPETPQNSPPAPMPMQPLQPLQSIQPLQSLQSIQPIQPPQVHQENVGGTTYFYSTSSDTLNASMGANITPGPMVPEPCLGVGSPYAQLYTGVPPHLPMPVPKTVAGIAPNFYSAESIRAEMLQRNEDIFLQPDPQLPESVDAYAELTPLEALGAHQLASSYRAVHRAAGEQAALRRLHACAPPPAAQARLDAWRNIDHPNVVRLNHFFATKEFGDLSLVLVYDYYSGSMTLMTKYLLGGNPGGAEGNGAFHDPFSSDPDAPRPYTHQKNAMLRAVACGALLPETVVWSILVQITAGLRVVHAAGLACRSLDPTKVIITGCRVRIAWCGVPDALHSANIDIAQAQQDDLTALGRLVLALACRTTHCDNLPACVDLVARSYSADLKNLILYLLSSSRRSVVDLMPMIGARFYSQVESLERRADAFEEQLAREVDNGRLLRILIKLGVVNERPELNLDSSWSETGDRYMLKLFRDYLFHSVTADGRPWLDQAHLTNALNSLDGGSLAKVELMSRDEQSVLVVSYSELKHCLEAAFEEVMQAAGSST